MSESLIPRTNLKVFFAGVDISTDVAEDLISLSYTDNEEDESDDIQFKLKDTSGRWLTKWLSAVGSSGGGAGNSYSVTSDIGLNIRSGPGTEYTKLGVLAYGTKVSVEEINGDWAKISYSGKTAYVCSDYIEPTTETAGASGEWHIGDSVIVSGRPQYTSYGEGTPGANVTNYKGQITYLNLRDGVPYPIHVGFLGWFAVSQVQKTGTDVLNGGEYYGEGLKACCKGMKIQATIVPSTGGVVQCGQYELDSVTASGPPATVTIRGTALPYSSSARQSKNSKSWENYDLAGIANEIASRNGMSCMFDSDINPEYERVEQYKQSDITFLQKLCRDCGCSLKVYNNIIVIFEQKAYERKPHSLVISPGSGYTQYQLKTGEDDTYTSCRVSYVDNSGKLIEATAYSEEYDDDGQCLEITQKVSGVAEAKRVAEYNLKLHNKYELSATFTFPGSPALIAGRTVRLEGWGAWSGKYMISQATHQVSRSGYTTKINLRKIVSG